MSCSSSCHHKFHHPSSSDGLDSRGLLRQPRVATTTSLGPFSTNAEGFSTNAEGCTIADLLDPAHRALSQVAAARTGSRFGPGWRQRPGRPRHSWIIILSSYKLRHSSTGLPRSTWKMAVKMERESSSSNNSSIHRNTHLTKCVTSAIRM